MLIESFVPLRIQTRFGDIRIQPGCPVEMSEKDGLQLLRKAPGKVKRVPALPSRPAWQTAGSLRTGMIATWLSPALPQQRATVLDVREGEFLVHHPLAEQELWLPQSWINKIEP